MECSAKYLTEIKMQTSLQPLGFINPVRNKTKAIKPVFQRWSPLSQLLTVPDFFPCVRPPALWYLFRCIYGSPGRALVLLALLTLPSLRSLLGTYFI